MTLHPQKASLVLQFIFSELLNSTKILRKAPPLFSLIKLMGGPPLSYEEGLSLASLQKGSIKKLNAYFALLTTTVRQQDTSLKTACKLIQKIEERASFLLLKHAHGKLYPSEEDIHSIETKLVKVSQICLQKIPQFKEDESFLFFLLRRHKDFQDFYGYNIILKIFKSLFPEGPDQLNHYLTERYRKRGFDTLRHDIDKLIQELHA